MINSIIYDDGHGHSVPMYILHSIQEDKVLRKFMVHLCVYSFIPIIIDENEQLFFVVVN